MSEVDRRRGDKHDVWVADNGDFILDFYDKRTRGMAADTPHAGVAFTRQEALMLGYRLLSEGFQSKP